MIYSPTCQHAIRALVHLAMEEGNGPVLVRRIAETESIPHPFLAKILHGLGHSGLVRSTRGPGGGYELARPAAEIRVLEVVRAVDGTGDLSDVCVLGLDACSDERGCALHDEWKRFRDRLQQRIAPLTLADLARTLARKRAKGL